MATHRRRRDPFRLDLEALPSEGPGRGRVIRTGLACRALVDKFLAAHHRRESSRTGKRGTGRRTSGRVGLTTAVREQRIGIM